MAIYLQRSIRRATPGCHPPQSYNGQYTCLPSRRYGFDSRLWLQRGAANAVSRFPLETTVEESRANARAFTACGSKGDRITAPRPTMWGPGHGETRRRSNPNGGSSFFSFHISARRGQTTGRDNGEMRKTFPERGLATPESCGEEDEKRKEGALK